MKIQKYSQGMNSYFYVVIYCPCYFSVNIEVNSNWKYDFNAVPVDFFYIFITIEFYYYHVDDYTWHHQYYHSNSYFDDYCFLHLMGTKNCTDFSSISFIIN